jgi:hypothetical protein
MDTGQDGTMRIAVLAVVAAIALAACTPMGTRPHMADATPTSSSTSAVPFPAPANVALDVGETAAMRVFLHCGLRYATIDGTTWETTPQGHGSAPSGLPDLMTGDATRISQDTVHFKSSTPTSALWVFHPAADSEYFVCY